MFLLKDAVRLVPLYVASVIIFILMLIFTFINGQFAALLSLMLLGLWSRVPTMLSLYFKDLEFIDFLAFTVAMALGGTTAAIFAFGTFAVSILFAKNEHPIYWVMDGLGFPIAAALSPLFFAYTGSLLMSMYLFTATRYIVSQIVAAFGGIGHFMLNLQILFVSVTIALVTNTVFVKLFGDATIRLSQEGLKLNFSVVAIIIVVLGLMTLTYFMDKKAKALKAENKGISEPHRPFN